jgi:hypothetical protein
MMFVMREGIKGIFGRVGGSIARDSERDEEEREAEQALRELAAARDDESLIPENASVSKPAVQTEAPEAIATRAERAGRRKGRPVAAEETEPPAADRRRVSRPERRAFAASDPVASEDAAPIDRETALEETPMRRRAYRAPDAGARAEEAEEAASFRDYFSSRPRLDRAMIAWIAGGAAGAAAVVAIAFTISGMHFG